MKRKGTYWSRRILHSFSGLLSIDLLWRMHDDAGEVVVSRNLGLIAASHDALRDAQVEDRRIGQTERLNVIVT